MKALDQTAITNLLTKDYIGRNSQLSVFIRLINSLDDSQILAIDGAWGSGKTVFVKQLELLCEESEELNTIPSIDQLDIRELRDNHTTIYYNAWENDFYDDALQSILYNLFARIDKTSGELMENSRKKAASMVNIPALIKNISRDGIDLDGKTSNEKLTSEIRDFVNRKDRIKEFLQKLIGESDKRILFIIDELDRCSPTFAVKVLEVIKHYFEIDGITFVVAVNTEQLAHTVKKFYGNDFDGYGYLNKFFDFPFSLKAPDTDQFIERYLGIRRNSHFSEMVSADIAKFLRMSMREIESYFAALELIKDYMKSDRHYYSGSMAYSAQLLFVPLALALRIKAIVEYKSFIVGDNAEILPKLLAKSDGVQRFVESLTKRSDNNTERASLDDFIQAEYRSMFNYQSTGDYHVKEIHADFSDVVNLINSYTTIKSKNSEGKE